MERIRNIFHGNVLKINYCATNFWKMIFDFFGALKMN